MVYQESIEEKLKLALEDIMLRFEEKGYSCICAADWEKKISFEKTFFRCPLIKARNLAEWIVRKIL